MDRRRFLGTSVAGAITLAHASRFVRAAPGNPVPGDVEAVTGGGTRTVLGKSALQNLRDSLRGSLFLAGEPGYDEARRVIDRSVDRRPALVVQPSGVSDIRTAVDFARSQALLLAVKCGGHSAFRSTCDGGMMIDLSRCRGVRVDPPARIADVGGGCLLGDVDHEAMAFGLVTPAGVVSHTGVGGLTLGGGFGRLQRRWGLTLDNVLGADIVTADGGLRRCGPDENPDLYWAIRGGGGNFGIVTSFRFRLHPMQRQIVGGRIIFPLSRARDVLDFYGTFSMQAPDELYVEFQMGQRCLMDVCWSGDARAAERVLAPLAKLGTPLENRIKTIDYLAIQRDRDRADPLNRSEERRGLAFKTGFSHGFEPGLASALAQYSESPDRRFSLLIQQAGGAVARIAPDDTAFPHRTTTHVMSALVTWNLPADDSAHRRFLDEYWAAVEPFVDGYYANLADREPRVVEQNYRGNLARLQRIKNKYDPTNLFRLNANIRPTV